MVSFGQKYGVKFPNFLLDELCWNDYAAKVITGEYAQGTWDPVDAERKLNGHKAFRRPPGPLLNVSCTFNLRPVSTGEEPGTMCIKERKKLKEAKTNSFWQLSVKLPVKYQCFSKSSFCIICAALLRCVLLFCNECSREYSKAVAKLFLKEIKTSFCLYVYIKF